MALSQQTAVPCILLAMEHGFVLIFWAVFHKIFYVMVWVTLYNFNDKLRQCAFYAVPLFVL